MLKILIAMYVGGWAASASPFYATTKAANPNQPIRNAFKAFGLSAAWIVSIIPIMVIFIKDLIERFKPKTTTTTTETTATKT
ncbi:MAG: hypothetical protein WC919_01990 [Candidatus Paceibacterota bacterium]